VAAGALVLAPGLPCLAADDAASAPAAEAAQDSSAASAEAGAKQPEAPAAAQVAQTFDIFEFRIDGAEGMSQVDVEAAVYPFLGPNKSSQDVDKARAALEKAYHDKGLQTVAVAVPEQNVEGGTVVLNVTEAKVGRLRVKKSRYFDPDRVRSNAPSLQEGVLPNFNDVTKDIIALNQLPDRRVTPALRAGVTPGTIDVDLNVEDKAPVHASVELNNRQSPNTTPLRVNTTVRYDNLWQRGHSLSLSYQVAPQRIEDAEVVSASYLARLTDWTSVLVYGVDSSSDIATVGDMNVIGPGQILGARAVLTLPSLDGFYQSLSFGLDYKHFGQIVDLGEESFSSPITYYPAVANYSATWQGEKVLNQLNAGVTYNWRGPGSDFDEFWAKRAYAASNFAKFNADLVHTRELAEGFQFYAKIQGQFGDGPLVSSEQFSLGGMDTVRGYLETEAIGDNGFAATVEMRTPDLAPLLQTRLKESYGDEAVERVVFNELRLFAFVDGGAAKIYWPLPEQESTFMLWSYGIGARFKALEYLDGSIVLAMPKTDQPTTTANEPRVLFSVTGGF